ncbi:hypothetical protein DdX_19246 [Ditylenchus destructor]|uniref:Uncharacterized protein n=1 Tax=Ditylenchus destructor TaxID=166010 RepID=A0AAD4MMZ5_9BILA|nr:hypothetical protein DdX_19246 [Ditylenchus destructor]
MYAVTHFYELPNEIPRIHGINLLLSDAVEIALEKVQQIANLNSWSEQINQSREFYEEFSHIPARGFFDESLKSSIKILIETFSMNNQIDNWCDKVVKIFLMSKTDQTKICNGYLSYDLAGGNHLGLNVVYVLEDMTGGNGKDYISNFLSGCDNHHPRDNQMITYKIDHGFSRVRLFDDYKISQEIIERKSNEIHSMSLKAAEIGNGAYLPTVHKELFKLVDNFYDGHTKLLSFFDRHMSDLFEFRLLSMGNTNYCTEIPSAAFSSLENQILGLISTHWKRENENNFRDQFKGRDLPTNIPQMILNRKGIPPNELIDYSCLGCLPKVSFQNNALNLSLTEACEHKLHNISLYFGMTVLTLFELAIFVFYRDQSKIKMQRVPDQSVIYDLPRNPKKTSQMVHQRKTRNNNIHGLYKNEANSIIPTIF